VECLAETYAEIMPPAFFEQQRAAVPERVAAARRALTPAADGGEPATRSWLVLDGAGEAVGVARSGPGPQPYEAEIGAPPASVDFELHHIYTRRHTYGTGVGQALFEVAVGGRDVYLWILHGNLRAERFYRRNGLRPDGVEIRCGPLWFHRPMFRMVRQTAGQRCSTEAGRSESD
jgi:GNAT superfamily N-acetyltransferase